MPGKKTVSRREYWEAEHELKWNQAMIELQLFIEGEPGKRDWNHFQEYKRLMKAANKAYGVMRRCKY